MILLRSLSSILILSSRFLSFSSLFHILLISLLSSPILSQPFESFSDNAENIMSKVTVVSGHWLVSASRTKHPINFYKAWWEKAMVLNCPYIVYGMDLTVVEEIRSIRQKYSLPTMYKYRNLTRDMYPRFEQFNEKWVAADIPSKEVAVIWLDKIFMIEDAIRSNPFKSDWFVWNDAGNAAFRRLGPDKSPPLNPKTPWPHPAALASLPTDKFIFTLSWIPWKKHYIAGTAFMYHKNIQTILSDRFMTAWHACLVNHRGWNKNICGSDQVVLSHVRNKYWDFFYQIGYGYGALIHRMTLDHSPASNVTVMKDLCYEQNGNAELLKSMKVTRINNLCADVWGIPIVEESSSGSKIGHGKGERKRNKNSIEQA